ncbi:MAG: L-rhamnose mutarotase [Azospirillaceae bacterium]
MKRVAFAMKLKPACEAAYKKKHDEIWPELVAQMRARGTRNYSIYRHGLLLFAYLETEDADDRLNAPPSELTRRWWKAMEPYMECDGEGTPRRLPLEEVFHLD